MNQFEDHPELPLLREPNRTPIPLETVRAQRSPCAAFTLACNNSGLEDKEIYLSLGIDAGYFTNIKKGKATLQSDKVRKFCEIVGNTAYPEWMAYQLGCTLVVIKTEAERRAEEAERRYAESDRENKLMRQLLAGKVPV